MGSKPSICSIPMCSICERKPATCCGAYEDAEEDSHACDDCCSHACVDGYCEPIYEEDPTPVPVPASTTRYAVVRTKGLYPSDTRIHPERVTSNLTTALSHANRETAKWHQRGCKGGFRVVPTTAHTRRGVSWLGRELDLVPSIT